MSKAGSAVAGVGNNDRFWGKKKMRGLPRSARKMPYRRMTHHEGCGDAGKMKKARRDAGVWMRAGVPSLKEAVGHPCVGNNRSLSFQCAGPVAWSFGRSQGGFYILGLFGPKSSRAQSFGCLHPGRPYDLTLFSITPASNSGVTGGTKP